jgi:CDP-glucose 4,6-dehydratase
MIKHMSVLKEKNVLVTGAMGLVGAPLVKKLLEIGANVFYTCRSFNPNSYFVEQGLDKKTVAAICDLKDYNRVFDVISKYEIEYIFHVAAQPIVETAYYNPKETLNDNILGTINILEAARQYPKIKGVVVASTDKAYGKDCVNAVETQPLSGDHPYDVSKSCTDLIAQMYTRTYGLPVAISRFGNIYGPGDTNWNRIVPGIMKAIVKNVILDIRSDGSFVRDYVFVNDVVDGYILLAEKINEIKGEAFNFSTGYNFSVLDLIKNIPSTVGGECGYRIINNQKNEIPVQSLSFVKAQKKLGWKSNYTFEEGINKTFIWYKNYFLKLGK